MKAPFELGTVRVESVAILATDSDGAPVVLVQRAEDLLAKVSAKEGLAATAMICSVMALVEPCLAMG